MFHNLRLYHLKIYFVAKLLLKARHATIHKATRVDVVEIL